MGNMQVKFSFFIGSWTVPVPVLGDRMVKILSEGFNNFQLLGRGEILSNYFISHQSLLMKLERNDVHCELLRKFI